MRDFKNAQTCLQQKNMFVSVGVNMCSSLGYFLVAGKHKLWWGVIWFVNMGDKCVYKSCSIQAECVC